jgi:hypothetical protein
VKTIFFLVLKWSSLDGKKSIWPGLGPIKENSLKNSVNSCQIFWIAKIANQYF